MADKQRIFIVEDEDLIARFLQIALEKANFQTAIERNGKRAYERIVQEKYDLVLLDIMLPEMDGMEICEKVREISNIPIIMLTARDEIDDKVRGLELGADDYMTKPVAIKELLARINAVFRRHNEKPRPDETRLIIGEVIMFPERYEVKVGGKPLKLTHKEYELLLYLVTNKPNVLTRDQILQQVWGYDYTGDTNVVDVYISYLRKKIDRVLGEQYIFTIQGVGYAIRH